jgi:hypothetical protein
MTGINEGRVPEEPRIAQLQVLFELANAAGCAQEPKEICHAVVLRLFRAVAADRAAALIIDADDVIVSRRGRACQTTSGPPSNSTRHRTEMLATASTTNQQNSSVSVSPL